MMKLPSETRERALIAAVARRESSVVGPSTPRSDTEHRDVPMCPKCGGTDVWTTLMQARSNPPMFSGNRDGMTWKATCRDCMAIVAVTQHVTVTYSTATVGARKDALSAEEPR